MQRYLLIFTLLLSAQPLSAQSPKPIDAPSSKWVLNYGASSCDILRVRAGDINGLLLRLRPLSNSTELKILTRPSGAKPVSENIGLSIARPTTSAAKIATFADLTSGTDRVLETYLDSDELDRAVSDGQVAVHGEKIGQVVVSTRGIAKVLKAARPCLDDLERRWNVRRDWVVAAEAEMDPRSVFLAEDYPANARDSNLQGMARALLRLDATGKITECRPIETEGSPEFAKVTCAVLVKRAQFKPARDASGKAVPSFYLAPPVRFSLAF